MQLNPKGDHLAALLLFPLKGILIPRPHYNPYQDLRRILHLLSMLFYKQTEVYPNMQTFDYTRL